MSALAADLRALPGRVRLGRRAARCGDADGNEYLDFLAGISVCNTGHCHPRVVAAIREQAGALIHVSNLFITEPMARAGRAAVGVARSAARCFRQLRRGGQRGGDQARRARRGRGGDVVVVHGGFHGRTYGALSATPQESKQAPFAPLVPGFVARADAEALDARGDRRDTAAVLLEPIQGETGVHPLPAELLRVARGVRPHRRRAGVRRGPDRASAAPARCGRTSRPGWCPTR